MNRRKQLFIMFVKCKKIHPLLVGMKLESFFWMLMERISYSISCRIKLFEYVNVYGIWLKFLNLKYLHDRLVYLSK